MTAIELIHLLMDKIKNHKGDFPLKVTVDGFEYEPNMKEFREPRKPGYEVIIEPEY